MLRVVNIILVRGREVIFISFKVLTNRFPLGRINSLMLTVRTANGATVQRFPDVFLNNSKHDIGTHQQ